MREVGLSILRDATRTHDPDDVELGLHVGFIFGMTEDYGPLLLELASEPWHQRHEDVVAAIQDLAVPNSEDSLYKLATRQYAYLEYDECFALGVKCIYALGALHEPAALQKLALLRSCGNSVLEREADQRLRMIETSPDRSPEERRLAHELLASNG